MRRHAERPAELRRETSNAIDTPTAARPTRAAASLPGSLGWLCVALFISGASIFAAAIQAGSRFEEAPVPASRITECPEPIAAGTTPCVCTLE